MEQQMAVLISHEGAILEVKSGSSAVRRVTLSSQVIESLLCAQAGVFGCIPLCISRGAEADFVFWHFQKFVGLNQDLVAVYLEV